MKKKDKYNIAVVGVGAVGIEMLRVLKHRNFPAESVRVYARSARDIDVDGVTYKVEQVSPESFEGADIALFAGTEGEKGAAVTYASEAVKRGAVVIDNGADFRMEPDVPLIVPEVNPDDIKNHKGIISNPNCSTIQMVVALYPVYKKAGLERVIVTTLQAASGAGRSAVKQLESELAAEVNPKAASPQSEDRVLPSQLACNVIPQIGGFGEAGYTSEEWKLVKETHKIMHDDSIKISATTIRVPVRTGHAESVYFQTRQAVSVQEIRTLLSKAPGVILMDEPADLVYPMPKDVEGRDETFVGRIRQDCFVKNGYWMWVVADNLRKGAATNAIQIAELLINRKK